MTPEQLPHLTPAEQEALRLAEAATPIGRQGIAGNMRLYGPDNSEDAGLVAVFMGQKARGNMQFVESARTALPAALLALAEERRKVAEAMGLLEIIGCPDCRNGVLLSDSLMFDLDREDEDQPCLICAKRRFAIAVLRGNAEVQG